MKIDLGKTDFGKSAGYLLFYTNEQVSAVSPDMLDFMISSEAEATTVMSSGSPSYPRQILVDQALVDITEASGTFTIHFYNPADASWDSVNEEYDVSNLDATSELTFSVSGGGIEVEEEKDGETTRIATFTVDSSGDEFSVTHTLGTQITAIETLERVHDTISTSNYFDDGSALFVWADAPRIVETRTIEDGDNNVVYEEETTFQTFLWGMEKVRQVVDPDGAVRTNTWDYYISGAQAGGEYGRLRQRVDWDGYWERYEYDASGRTTKTVSRYGDTDPDSDDEDNRVVTRTWSTYSGDPVVTISEKVPSGASQYEVLRQHIIYADNETISVQCLEPGAAVTATSNLCTTNRTYSSDDFEGEPSLTINPDGTGSTNAYGYVTESGVPTVKVTTNYSGAMSFSSSPPTVTNGTVTVTKQNRAGTILGSETRDIVSDLVVDSNRVTLVDGYGRMLKREFYDTTAEGAAYDHSCCGSSTRTNRQGIVTTFKYDGLNRLTNTVAAGVAVAVEYDSMGNVTNRVRFPESSPSSRIVLETNSYDTAGQLESRYTVAGGLTEYSTSFNAAEHRVRTSTQSDAGTRMEEYYGDGTLKQVTGTAAIPLRYEYGVLPSHQHDSLTFHATYRKRIALNSSGSPTDEWSMEIYDMLGSSITTSNSGQTVTVRTYEEGGRIESETDPDGVVNLFRYTRSGELYEAIVDMGRDGFTDAGETDRVTRTEMGVIEDAGDSSVWSVVTTKVWKTDGSATATFVPSIRKQRRDGLESVHITPDETTETITTYDYASGIYTTTTTRADGSYSQSVYENSRLVSAGTYDEDDTLAAGSTYRYDLHGRRTAQTNSLNRVTSYAFDDADRITIVTYPPANVGAASLMMTNVYGVMGRLSQVVKPEGTVSNEYYKTGALKKTFGADTYPVEYAYDVQGRMTTMTTWTNHATSAGAAVTTWAYSTNRGFLITKTYEDNSEVGYTYTDGGRLKTREWARDQLTTTYAYNKAGQLKSVTYSDTTPSVTYKHDRAGRTKEITDASGTRTLQYSDAGQVTEEEYTSGVLSGLTLARTHENGRLAEIIATNGTAEFYAVDYGRDGVGRLSAVTNGLHVVGYDYQSGANLLDTVSFTNNGTEVMVTTRVFDGLDRLTSISTASGTNEVDEYGYTYQGMNRRTRVDLVDGGYWDYAYDDKGQLISGVKRQSDGTAYSGQQFGYAFDDIGNRTSTTNNSQVSVYSANEVNQYVSRTVPGAVDLIGVAASNATVTVSSEPVTARQGTYFHKQAQVDNSEEDVYGEFTVVGVLNNVNVSNEDAVATSSRHRFVPEDPEAFAHDDDGNLTRDGRWTNTWNGENRLVKMETRSDLDSSVPDLTVEFAYDSQGRRFKKTVTSNSVSSTTYFIYDGWNLIAELESDLDLVRAYTWGTDLSGSFQGAGGVGGLLAVANAAAGSSHYPTYDGNGNVMRLVDASDASVDASYEYDPFGNILRQTGNAADDNPFRFSTKNHDDETGLVYYGLRSYSPGLGRWNKRDPALERGGLGLLAFVLNSPVSMIDPLGLEGTVGGDDPGFCDDAKKLLGDLRKKLKDPSVPQREKSQIRRRIKELSRSLSGKAHGADKTKVLRNCGKGANLAIAVVGVYFSLTIEAGAPSPFPELDESGGYWDYFGTNKVYFVFDPITGHFIADGTAPDYSSECAEEEDRDCCPCELETKTEPLVKGLCPHLESPDDQLQLF